ncbi:MAG: glycolate oxidase subunit GlcF [Betaproteobacteria bacterium]|nr:glycolate oxidase subunit GlcF [Betaproteobacteria bacterium]
MQTNLADWIKDTPDGQEADAILRKCVHCGFCLATCPTYQLTGDELDSPRGRIYLMKQVLEGAAVTEKTQFHLDRCLTCRACESTCPSGVQYGRLADIGRSVVETKVGRGLGASLQRGLLKRTLSSPTLFSAGLTVGRAFRPLLPAALKAKIPAERAAGTQPSLRHARHVLMLEGCVQPAMAPSINAAIARVLDRLGVSVVTSLEAGCCGALAHHLNDHAASHAAIRKNIDAWWPHIDAGAEAIVVTASGCGTMVADYGHVLRNDVAYAEKAKRVSELFCDASTAVAREREALHRLLATAPTGGKRIAFHSPCSLQHGLKIRGVVEELLTAAGFDLTPVPDGHLCCGSAGTYSILQPELSGQLLKNKVAALESGQPEGVATANIGCLAHIEGGLNASSKVPIRHWVEWLDERLNR